MTKKFIFLGMFFGSFIGGYVPALWGGSVLSLSSIFLSGIGGLLGIYAGFKISQNI